MFKKDMYSHINEKHTTRKHRYLKGGGSTVKMKKYFEIFLLTLFLLRGDDGVNHYC